MHAQSFTYARTVTQTHSLTTNFAEDCETDNRQRWRDTDTTTYEHGGALDCDDSVGGRERNTRGGARQISEDGSPAKRVMGDAHSKLIQHLVGAAALQ